MKRVTCFLVVCCFTIAAYGAEASGSDKPSNEIPQTPEELKNSRLFESEITELFNQLQQALESGIPALGIPSLKVIEYPELNLNNLESSLLSGDIYLSNIVLQGITNFIGGGSVSLVVTQFPNLGKINLELEFSSLDLATEYNGNLNLFGMIDLQGTGDIRMLLNNFKLNIGITAAINIINVKILEITDAPVTLQLPSTIATITGLFNDEFMSDIISRQLSDTLTALAEEESARLSSLVTTELLWPLIEEINKILAASKKQNLTEEDIYEWLLPAVFEKAKEMYFSKIPEIGLNKKLQ